MNHDDIERILFDDSPALIKGDFIVNAQAKADYESALKLIQDLHKGNPDLFGYSVDDPQKPYYIHTISITWNIDEEGIIEIDNLRPLTDIMQKFSGLIFDDEGKWQLGICIYKKA